MTVLVVDGERGIVKDHETKAFCLAHGITVQERAPDQHARIVERRGALLRDATHRCDAQLRAEAITDVPFEQRLNECVFSGNALLSINGCTPYNAVYGRTPPLLPGLEVLNTDGVITPLTDRQVGRVRT